MAEKDGGPTPQVSPRQPDSVQNPDATTRTSLASWLAVICFWLRVVGLAPFWSSSSTCAIWPPSAASMSGVVVGSRPSVVAGVFTRPRTSVAAASTRSVPCVSGVRTASASSCSGHPPVMSGIGTGNKGAWRAMDEPSTGSECRRPATPVPGTTCPDTCSQCTHACSPFC